MQKTISVLAIAGSIAFLGAGAAQAQTANTTYPAPVVNVSNNVIVIGGTVIFFGEGFVNNGTINITIVNNGGQPVGAGAAGGRVGAVRTGVLVPAQIAGGSTVTADGTGAFSVPVTFDTAGSYTLTASGENPAGEDFEVVAYVTVLAAGAAAPIDTDDDDDSTGGTTTTTRGGLANTGIDSAMVLWGAAGIGALGLGAGSIVVARRRTGAEA